MQECVIVVSRVILLPDKSRLTHIDEEHATVAQSRQDLTILFGLNGDLRGMRQLSIHRRA